jgi:hypothetical protein
MSKVIWEVKDMQISEKLTRVWPIVKWLDDARWNASASGSLIPGPVFVFFASAESDIDSLALLYH